MSRVQNDLKRLSRTYPHIGRFIDNTDAVATAVTTSQGVEIIEALEIPDKRFILGVQFHPEIVMVKHDKKAENESDYMSYTATLQLFEALANAAKR